MGENDNGYIKDKKYIEECFRQNEREHQEIKELLAEIKNKYCMDVIILKTQVKILGTAILLMFPPLLTLIVKAIIVWINGRGQ